MSISSSTRLVVALASLCLPIFAVQDGLIGKIKQHFTGFQPEAILDIGANKGDWSTRVRQVFPDAKLFLLEASPQQEDRLKEVTSRIGNAQYEIGVFSSREGEVVSFFQGGDTGNSMFQEDTKYYENDKPVERITTTVDRAVESFQTDKVIDIIKADVQGAELVVFQGATKALSQATFVQFEGSSVQYNVGGSCFFHVDDFLRSHGFFLYDMADFAYNRNLFKTNGVGQFDVLYIKPTSPRLPESFRAMGATYCGQGESSTTLSTQSTSSFEDAVEPTIQYIQSGLQETGIEVGERGGRFLIGFLSGILSCVMVLGVTVVVSRSLKQKGSKIN